MEILRQTWEAAEAEQVMADKMRQVFEHRIGEVALEKAMENSS